MTGRMRSFNVIIDVPEINEHARFHSWAFSGTPPGVPLCQAVVGLGLSALPHLASTTGRLPHVLP